MNRQPARGIAPGCDIYTDLLHEDGVVEIPCHPNSCSSGSTNFADRRWSHTGSVCADRRRIRGGIGSPGQAPGKDVVSDTDRRTGKPYINQIVLGRTSSPATPGDEHIPPAAG
jgi:N-methylhydantoinase B